MNLITHLLHSASTATTNICLSMKNCSNVLCTFFNPKSIIDSESESKSDHDPAFNDALHYKDKAEDDCKISKSSGLIPNDISGFLET